MSATLLERVLLASFDGALAILVVGVASFFLAGAPALRSRLWWAACLKLLITFAGLAPVTLPILPAASVPSALLRLPSLPHTPSAAAAPELAAAAWRSGALLLYLAGLGIGAVLTLSQLLRVRRLIRLAVPIRDPRAERLLAELGRTLNVRRLPDLRVSALVRAPQVVGSIRPIILLPRIDLNGIAESDLAMMLAHELLHVRRHDLLLGWIPALARRLFFFHPGAWIAVREYALAREAACDAGVIRALDASPRRYAALLVEMSIAGCRVRAPAAAMSSSLLHLRRRIRMLEQATNVRPRTSLRWALVALLAIAVLLPVRLAARSTRPSEGPATAAAGNAKSERGAVDAYVFFLDDSTVAMSGNMQDLDHARELRGSEDGELLWLRKGNREYVVRDPSVLKSIRELHASLGESDAGEDERGKREEELEQKQDRLAAEQDALSAHAEALAREAERLEERSAGARSEQELSRARELMEEEERRMEKQQIEAEREMERLGAQIDALSAEQDKRGEEADRVSSQIELQIQEILEEALRSGKAERVRPAI